VKIDKDTVLDFLREQGKDQQAQQAEQELPDEVDTDQDAGLLQRFGVDPKELAGKFLGGRDVPGL
jgi:hypothetical protein